MALPPPINSSKQGNNCSIFRRQKIVLFGQGFHGSVGPGGSLGLPMYP